MTRNIVITGATGDIAAALIKNLPDDHLILLSRNLSALTEKYGHLPNVTLLENDSVSADRNFDRQFSVDILINNAGIGVFKPLMSMSDEEIRQQFEVNSLFPIMCWRFFNPQVQVINIASIAGKVPSPKSSIYAASKAALINFSDAMRMENPEIIVTTVNTGPVKTKFHADNQAYLTKVGSTALTADQVAQQILKNLGKRKREINLPVTLKIVAKMRMIFPSLVDFLAGHFFNFK